MTVSDRECILEAENRSFYFDLQGLLFSQVSQKFEGVRSKSGWSDVVWPGYMLYVRSSKLITFELNFAYLLTLQVTYFFPVSLPSLLKKNCSGNGGQPDFFFFFCLKHIFLSLSEHFQTLSAVIKLVKAFGLLTKLRNLKLSAQKKIYI